MEATAGATLFLLIVMVAAVTNLGGAFAEVVRERAPSVRVIFITGYGGDIESDLAMFSRSTVLYKPFTVSTLAKTIRESLTNSEAAAARPF